MSKGEHSSAGRGQDSGALSLLHFDRKLALGFGALLLFLMLLVCAAGMAAYRSISRSNEAQLTTALTGVLADSINRSSFSGRYHTRLLLEEIVAAHDQLAYVFVADTGNTIIAHSDPERNNTPLPEHLTRIAVEVQATREPVVTRATSPAGPVQETVVPYLSGFEEEVAGVIVTGLSLHDMARDLQVVSVLLVSMIVLLTVGALFATLLMSRHLATPVRQMARRLQGILTHAPVYIGIYGEDGAMDQVSASGEQLLRSAPNPRRWPFPDCPEPNGATSSEVSIREAPFLLDGEQRVATVISFPIGGSPGEASARRCAIAVDITEQRHAEEAVRRHRDQLEDMVSTRTRALEQANETIRHREREAVALGHLREQLLGAMAFNEKYCRMAAAARELLEADAAVIWTRPANTPSAVTGDDKADWAPAGWALSEDASSPPPLDAGEVQAVMGFSDFVIELEQGAIDCPVPAEWIEKAGFQQSMGVAIGNVEGHVAGVLVTYWLASMPGRRGALLEEIGNTASYVLQAEYAARELEEANRGLLRQERLATLGKLTATVSHELRNPLGTVRASFFTIEKQLAGANLEKVQRALDRGARSISRCDRIIEELLNFTRSTRLDAEKTELADWLTGEIEELAIPEDVRLETDLPGPCEVEIDRQAVYQCLVNLVNNGCDAMVDLPPENRRLGIRLRTTAQEACIIVEDTGPGIEPSVAEHVFDPLFSTKGFGTGLGLPLVQRLIQLHGGRIEIENRSEGGMRATLVLPRS